MPGISAETLDPLGRQGQVMWYFGEGLKAGDHFSYKICDSFLKISGSSNPCYDVTLQFLQLLPSPQGKMWIVAAHIDHTIRDIDTIFQISEDSFEIKTDGTTIQYAQSIERTLGWLNHYTSRFEPQPLAIGKSWGIVASDTNSYTELVVNRLDSVLVGEQTYQTYNLGYSLVKESMIQLKDDFPFPVRAIVYKPVSSHQDIPLTFTAELLSYSNSELCSLVFDDVKQSKNEVMPQSRQTVESHLVFDELSGSDSNNEFETISTEKEIAEIENYTNSVNQTETIGVDYQNVTLILNQDYKKIKEIFGNFTKFLEFLANSTDQMMKNQTKN